MPGLNHNGPMGQGPMSGRGMGRCTNFGANRKDQPQSENVNDENTRSENTLNEEMPWGRNKGYGRGRGFGFWRGRCGFGMGRQNRFRGGC
ncbi:MAG: hypothetical protein EOM90_08435 [Alphaproteobacteria bacterium]|nr:hypothetical protein [Alphaproteobacteria bacterium]